MYKWLIPFCLLWTSANAGPAYRWVDEGGQVHYSDRPAPGAQRVELAPGGSSVFNALAGAPPGTQPARAPGMAAAAPAGIAVMEPLQGETLWGAGGRVQVALRISPELQPGHRLGYYLDGEFTRMDFPRMEFQLRNVHRGMHTLQAVILNEQNEEILFSSAVTFYVQQTSIYYPRNPNGNRSGR